MPGDDPLQRLSNRLGQEWPNIAAARRKADDKLKRLSELVGNAGSSDLSVVVFGSLGRRELTRNSDLDWTLLIDGQCDPFHINLVRDIKDALKAAGEKDPSPRGAFAQMAFSHDLIHQIGGEDDSNSNTTRRILLLLESVSVGRSDAYHRVLRSLLTRYLNDDRGLVQGSGLRVPHFLLNDLARYWRTMTVDFARKQWQRANDGYAIRNIKLRFSRKLLFISGLLTCFSFELALTDRERDDMFSSKRVQSLVEWLVPRFRDRVPLEVVADALLAEPDIEGPAAEFFGSYDRFLGILDDDGQRKELEAVGDAGLESQAYQRARDESHRFRDSIRQIFLNPEPRIGKLTIEYGVF